jgi:hypothetical protein
MKRILLVIAATMLMVSCGQEPAAESKVKDIVSNRKSATGYVKVSKDLVVGTEGQVITTYGFAWCEVNSTTKVEICKQMGKKSAYAASELSVAKFKKLGLGLMQILALPAEAMAASAAIANVTVTSAIVGIKKVADYILSEKDTDYKSSDNILSVYFFKFKNYITDKVNEVTDAVAGRYNEDNEKFNNKGTYAGLGWIINKLNPLGSFNESKLYSNDVLEGTMVTNDIMNIKAQLESELAKLDAN